MPFTPFHIGPALFLGIPLRKHIHAPTFILANVILDVEPLLVLVSGVSYPLHGYLHTFIIGVGVGVVFALAMVTLERIGRPIYKTLMLEGEATFKKRHFLVAGVLGTTLHILFDSPLYFDIRPFYPLAANPLYGSVSSSEIYYVTVVMGILGMIFYLLLAVQSALRSNQNTQLSFPKLKSEEEH